MSVVEVFVKGQKALSQTDCLKRVEPGHPCMGTVHGIAIREESVLPKADQNALEIVMAIAKEKGLEVKVYDLSKTVGRVKARLKGVRKTPAVLVGDKRIDGEILRDTILNILTQ